ncbi:MAG: hypothetical protein Q4C43_08015 [Prevotella sp.]|nr:hypothetical protein [Prevotella sp.]MDO4934460.1 hypothetical protein [Prevotella sp.]
MKRFLLSAGLSVIMLAATAQNSYIVKTKGARKAATAQNGQGSGSETEEKKAHDFVSDNFKFHSLCDWREGMRFMVLPEKYDLVVNTFCDAATGKEVSSGRLRYKIMVYKGHDEAPDGHARIHFVCEDDSMAYYYQVPNGTFEDYCYGKLGVPTLAYLGDVDIARTKLMGAKLYTKATLYRVDTQMDGDGYEEMTVPLNEEVTVKAVGVGSRSYPVKIIVEDRKGRQFYQNVAMSKTNCGMRDDEFIMDNAKFTFNGSFELIDAKVTATGEYARYIGKPVYTKYATTMTNAEDKNVRIARMSSFTIEKILAQDNTNYVKMTLKSTASGAVYTKRVTFVNENVAGDIDGYKEDYFHYLFGQGSAGLNKVPASHRKMIQQGRVAAGFTKEEVRMAKGEPNRTASASNGRVDWIYNNGTIVKFNSAGKVIGVRRH